MEKGEGILTVEEIFHLTHADFGREDDYPPDGFMEELIETESLKGEKLGRGEWDKMLDEYCRLHS